MGTTAAGVRWYGCRRQGSSRGEEDEEGQGEEQGRVPYGE